MTVITGFLGAGKTTLVARLLRHPKMDRVAVVINEIGAIGIDHDLVSQISESVSLLANGCLCCSVRTDLQHTLRALFQDRVAGLIPEFDRVMLETTGLADPAPVVQSLLTDPLLAKHFFLDGVVTLVDAEHGNLTLQTYVESVKQVAIADLILLTKSDRVSEDALQEVKQAVANIQPYAQQSLLMFGDIEPSELIGRGLSSCRATEAVSKLFPNRLIDQQSMEATDHVDHSRPLQQAIRHTSGIKTFSITWNECFEWDAFSSALELLANLRGQDLLRVKGIINVMGKPVVVQGVQHVFHPPVELDCWPSADQNSRLVFIGRRLDANAIRVLFHAAGKLRADD